MSDHRNSDRLLIPALGGLWAGLHNFAETLLRVVAGGLLISHGWPKIQSPFGLTEMIAGSGLPFASFFSLGVSAIEFFGGILLVLGLFTRLASLGALIVLLNTVYFHWVVFQEGFQGAEYSVLWATVAFFFLIRGGNAHSVDAKLARTF
ncbi:DoxX family protein [Xinfangfangia sp. D13-10-4-6]|uniref:DoxX family protein n=1 Tax=Pseudogemmobacter hezensis TaxID=2737662 RepID=UPI001553D827|nr:DoxX family protein [Pseudogemmobacter hezensis]NPD14859.1 DoxX family protein [Pseudogemmobacter hezensis]